MDFIMPGTKGNQFGNLCFSTTIPFAERKNVIIIDPEVQRKINNKKVKEISKYIIDALTGKRKFAVLGSISCSLRNAEISMDEANGQIRFNSKGKLAVLDGQHRINGIDRSFEIIENKIKEAHDALEEVSVKYWEGIKEQLSSFSLNLLIYQGMSKEIEAQCFFDQNHLASPATASQALYLDSSDLYNRMAKELELEIPQFNKYGVHKTAKALSSKNEEITTLAVWNSCIRIVLNGSEQSNIKNPWNEEWDYNSKKDMVKEFWLSLFEVLPSDFNNREQYIITKSVFLLGLSGLIKSSMIPLQTGKNMSISFTALIGATIITCLLSLVVERWLMESSNSQVQEVL